jgi:alkanesulfonate monooxygenase SsuD/methylene tetrahydromethanopterin reductase-like flavin-dependent oxidoreductase (luciferase family)
MFGLTPAQTAERFESTMPAVLEALETGIFRRPGADGAGEAVPLHVPVRQKPHPPLWYPTSNPDSIPRLGEQGYNVIFGFGFFSPPLAVVREQSRLFFERFRASAERGEVRYGLPGVTPRFGLMRHVLVAPTDDEALALLRPAFADHHANFTHLWRLHGDERRSAPVDVDRLLEEGKLYAGSPETVARQVAEAVVGGEVNYVAGAFSWGSLDAETSLRSLRLFRDEVIPAVRRVVSAR